MGYLQVTATRMRDGEDEKISDAASQSWFIRSYIRIITGFNELRLN